MGDPSRRPSPRVLGRYALYDEIASGGMATVHLGRLLGPAGFSRTVAIKCLHAHFAKNPEFVAMFLDEARVAARIRHPNVMQTLDVVALKHELFLVMEYVQGETLAALVRRSGDRGRRIPPRIVSAILSGVLHGLHAAHEATNERGEPLDIVHRDVSPQNVLVGADGVARVLDFGIAKASGRVQITREGRVKGKIGYMSPEQMTGRSLDRRTDVYSASVVLWEALTGARLFEATNEYAAAELIKNHAFDPPSRLVPSLDGGVDDLVARGLAYDPAERFGSAREMAVALERCARLATPSEIADWVEETAGAELARRAEAIAWVEEQSAVTESSLDTSPADPPILDARVEEDPEGTAPTHAVIHPPPDLRIAPSSEARSAPGPATPAAPPSTVRARGSSRALAVVLLPTAALVVLVALLSTVHAWRGPEARAEEPAAGGPVTLPETFSVTPTPTPPPASSGTAAAATPRGAESPAPVSVVPWIHKVSTKAARSAPADAAACKPPYVVDPQGIRHIKRECVP